MRTALSSHTTRMYLAHQRAFVAWAAAANYTHPLTTKVIASYLAHIATTRGRSAVPVHFAAIAKLYRSAGWPLDSKSHPIQRILANSRKRPRRHP